MKVTKDGKLKLAKNDLRVGNYVATLGERSVRLADIGENVCVSVSRETLNGRYLEMAFGESPDAIRVEALVAGYMLSVPKDARCLEAIVAALDDCVRRHPELYGAQDGTDAEHDAAALEVREMEDFAQEVASLGDAPAGERGGGTET